MTIKRAVQNSTSLCRKLTSNRCNGAKTVSASRLKPTARPLRIRGISSGIIKTWSIRENGSRSATSALVLRLVCPAWAAASGSTTTGGTTRPAFRRTEIEGELCRASGTRGRYSPSAGAAGLRVQQPRQWCSSWFVLLERQQLARQRLVEQRGPNFKKKKSKQLAFLRTPLSAEKLKDLNQQASKQ